MVPCNKFPTHTKKKKIINKFLHKTSEFYLERKATTDICYTFKLAKHL